MQVGPVSTKFSTRADQSRPSLSFQLVHSKLAVVLLPTRGRHMIPLWAYIGLRLPRRLLFAPFSTELRQVMCR